MSLELLNSYFETGSEPESCGTCDNCVAPVPQRLDLNVPTMKMTKAEENELLESMRANREKTVIKIGDAVTLPKFGSGVVKVVYDDTVEVQLENGGLKTFKTSFVEKKRE